MKQFLLVLSLFASLNACVTHACVDEDGFTPLERQKIAQSAPKYIPKTIMFLPTMSVAFDIIIDGETILYSAPVFSLNDVEVVCQVCGMPPVQIEVRNGELKCFCFNHIPKKRGSFLD